MKKQIALATTAAALLSTGAYASKARMLALGQHTDRGSHFIKDTRGVFLNPAEVASMNNYVITEWGDAATGSDSDTASSAQGGFFKNAGSFSYGLYLGADVGSQNGVRTVAKGGYAGSTATDFGSTSFVGRTNELDLFFAGDMGVEWGARLSYAASKNKSTTSTHKEADQSALGLGLGMVMGDISAHLNLGLSDKSENLVSSATEGAKWEADTAINVGATYHMHDWTLYAEYDTKGAEYTSATGVAKNETSQKTITIGAGHTHEVSSTSMIFTEILYKNKKSEDKDGTTATENIEKTVSTIPLIIGFEADATSWLVLRGSVTQNVLLNKTKTKLNSTGAAEGETSNTDTVDVNAGATLNFGKLKVDGMIGTGGNAGTGVDSESETGSLSLDRLMTRVAVHYWF